MSSESIAIDIRNLVKRYRVYDRPQDRLKQAMLPYVQRALSWTSGRALEGRGVGKQYCHEHTAIDDVSIRISKGESVGILGRNGSGKSTLLQMIASTLSPTSGSLQVNGRVSALLDLGAGFHPDFTGRENVELSASILGVSPRQVDQRLRSIIEFSEIGEFIDRPVREYSSGMFVRLAFATAIHVDADILVVDEALAVGDIRFQLKCFRMLEALQRQAVTVVLVTHSVEQVLRHCTRGIVLGDGKLLFDGSPKDAANCYMDLLFGKGKSAVPQSPPSTVAVVRNTVEFDARSLLPQATESLFETRSEFSGNEYRWGDRRAEIMDFIVLANASPANSTLRGGDIVEIVFRVRFLAGIATPVYGFFLRTLDGITVHGVNSRGKRLDQPHVAQRAGDEVVYGFQFRADLAGGDYVVSMGVSEDIDGELVPLDRRYDSILLNIQNVGNFIGICDLDARGRYLQ